MSSAFKADGEAFALWEQAYAYIPKSVFATAAWHLANACSDRADAPGAAEGRFLDELHALHSNGLITDGQHKRTVAAVTVLGLTRSVDA